MAQRDQQRVEDILGDVVFDYQPDPTLPIMSDHLETVMDEAFENGVKAADIYYDVLPDARARQFRDDSDFQEEVREYLEQSLVNAFAVTLDLGSWEETVGSIRRWQTYIDAADWMEKAAHPDDLQEDGVHIVFAMQNATALEGDVDRVDELHDFGVRMIQPTYNSRTLLGDGCTERTNAGLSHFGVDVVERMNELGIALDLSHCGWATTLDGIEVSDVPPTFSHIVCQDLYDHPRGKTDEEIQKLADAGGYAGIVAIPSFLGLSEDLEAMVDHIDHTVDIMGADRVWIASDWGVCHPETPDPLCDGLMNYYYEEMGFTDDQLPFDQHVGPMSSYTDWPEIPKALRERGYSDSEIEGICGTNFLEYWRTILD